MTGMKTYRGASLEELLPQIREELGADAVVLAQRDGIVGGIAGFFGRRCVEIDAAPAGYPEAPAATTIAGEDAAAAYSRLDVYDTDVVHDDDVADEEALPANDLARATHDLAAFAGILASFETATPAAAGLPAGEVDDQPAAPLPAPEAPPPLPTAPERAERPAVEPAVAEELAVRQTLAGHGLRPRSIESLLTLTQEHVAPLVPGQSLAAAVRAAIAGALHTPRGWFGRKKTIVLAGLEASSVAEVAAGLASAYAAGGKRVVALGLAGARASVPLVTGTEDVDVPFAICDEPDDVVRALDRLGEFEVLIAVAPGLADRASAERIGGLVAPLGRIETHLVLPAATPFEEARRVRELLERNTHVHGLLPTGTDIAPATGGTLALALEAPLAIRWVTRTDDARPVAADAAHLAGLVLS
ncbi:MAG: hypothetical protein U0R50_16995 [Gaiellales bacterium]